MATDRVRQQRFAGALAAMNGGSDRERRDAVITISALGRAEAYAPLLAALRDPDRKVRFNAMLGLTNRDDPARYADEIIAALASHQTGPARAAAAQEVINLRVGPGVLPSLGLSEQLAPEIELLGREGKGCRTRRQAAFVARGLPARATGA